MAARPAEPYDHLFKLLLVGDAAVGKSRWMPSRNLICSMSRSSGLRDSEKTQPPCVVDVQVWRALLILVLRASRMSEVLDSTGIFNMYLRLLRTPTHSSFSSVLRSACGPCHAWHLLPGTLAAPFPCVLTIVRSGSTVVHMSVQPGRIVKFTAQSQAPC